MKRIALPVLLAAGISFATCTRQPNPDPQAHKTDTTTNKAMKSYVSIFEIPAIDISRATNFYQAILDIKIERIDMPGMQMGIFPYDGQMVTGVILQTDGYQPSAQGVTIYLDGGDNLQVILDKIEKNGGKIMVPKTPHADEVGFFAIFLDSEGNRLGLHSPK